MEGRSRQTDDDGSSIDRVPWFRQRAVEVAGSSVFDACGVDRDTAPLGDVAFVAAVATGVAYRHTGGVPLGQLIDWTQERLGADAGRALEVTESAYSYFRMGKGVPGWSWTPGLVHEAMVTWLESQRDPAEAPPEACARIAGTWSFDEEEASRIERTARNWDLLATKSFALDRDDLRAVADRPDIRLAVDALPEIGRTSRVVKALAQDMAIARALRDDAGWAARIADLVADVERRFEALTTFERALLSSPSIPPAALGWAEHRNAIVHTNVMRAKGRSVRAFPNAACERVGDVTLIPDWLEMNVFNGRYLAGIEPGGPTATAWVLPGDLDDLATLQLDVDLEPHTEGRPGPPALAVYWRDATRAPQDWSWVSLMIQDSPESWSWLAVLAITRVMKIHVLALDDEGDLQLVRGALVDMENSVGEWADRFPQPPANVAERLVGMAEGHVVGGLQAAERSKSYDILELSVDEAADPELREARREVLMAEAARADRIWGLRDVDDAEAEVSRSWSRFREMRAWRHGKDGDTTIDPDVWLRELTDGIATPTRAIVHMMVDDGYLTLYWAGDGMRRGDLATSAPVPRLLDALDPWTREVSLRPTADSDPVADMMAAAAPVAEALEELAREQGLEHLVVVPWRGLHCVPWAAVGLADGTPLGHRVRITHAPAIRMLRRSIERSDGGGAAIAIGAHGSTLRRADAEAKLIAAIRGGTAVPDGTASDEVVRMMGAAKVIHIAGHASAGQYPLASAVLAGAPPLDPSQIISSARIHADADLSRCLLVMINACDSGRYAPPPRTFENHTGLDTACLSAGAAVVISTLWPVNDLVATIVAAVTHWHMESGKPPHEALDSAIAVLREGQGSSGVPTELRDLLDAELGPEWRDQIDKKAVALRHPYWWAAWRVSGADWLLD
jgi:hypothetical protein